MSLSETLIRIEYKLDLVMRALQDRGLMIHDLPDLMGLEGDACPLCRKPIHLSININEEQVERFCGCALSKRAVAGISSLLNPPEEATDGRRSRKASPEVPPDQAEGDGSGG